MQIVVKKLKIENFKGIRDLEVNFTDKMKIKGQNGSGKSTVFDAFCWCLFGKNSRGEEKFSIRPLDKDGNMIHNTDIKVIVVLSVNGKEIELLKCQREKWVKKRGSDVTELQGNENSFEIDGYPKSEADYKTYISGLVAEDLFKMLTNPQYFASRPWKEQRDILMKFVSEVSDVELARLMDEGKEEKDKQFTLLLPELEKAPSTDDIKNKFSKALSEWKKKQQEIPVRIDELSKSLVQIDVAEQELAKADLERKISEIDKKIADASSAVGDLKSEEMQLQFDMSGIMQARNRELSDKRRKLDNEKYEAAKVFTEYHNKIFFNEKQIESNNAVIEATEKKRSELGEQYKAEVAKNFDETPYLFHEEEWQFDENSTVCKSCGQVLPADRIEQIKADFEQRKANAKAKAALELDYQRNKFNEQKQSTLERIKAAGFEQKHFIEDANTKIAAWQTEIKDLKKQEQEALAKQNELAKQLEELPTEANYSQNAEYVKLKARHDEVVAEIAKVDSLGHDELMAQFEQEKKELQAELDSVKTEIAKASKNIEIEERIGELEAEQKEVGQKVADQEKMIYLLDKFIEKKMDMVSEEINKHFKYVSFRLFKEQINGGIAPTCEIKYVKESRGDLNSGHRIVAGLDIIQSLSELYGVTAPIFIDNAESLNEYNVPDMVAQMILLAVSDDKELKVEVE